MDGFAKPPKKIISLSSMEKKSNSSKTRKIRILNSINCFPDDKKNPNFKQPFLFRQNLLKFLLFYFDVFNAGLIFYNGNNFHVFEIKNFDVNFQFGFHTVFGFFDTFHKNDQKHQSKTRSLFTN